MSYSMTYDDGAARQTNTPVAVRDEQQPPADNRRYIRVPSVIKTATTFLTGAALFFGAEAYAPIPYRPSNLMGTYEARVQAEVKAAELTQQARYEAWVANVKVSVEQQAERYKAMNQIVLAHYQATLERSRTYAEAVTRLQSQYVAGRMSQTQATQGMDIATINWARLFGRVANVVQPGAGDDALRYANDLNKELEEELTRAALNGVTIKVDGWNTGLASVDDVRRELNTIQPLTIPPPPSLGEGVQPDSLSGNR